MVMIIPVSMVLTDILVTRLFSPQRRKEREDKAELTAEARRCSVFGSDSDLILQIVDTIQKLTDS